MAIVTSSAIAFNVLVHHFMGDSAVKRSEMMPATVNPAAMWTLNADKRSIRLTLPPLQLAGQPKPLFVALDFETTTVDEIIDRLLSLRAGMLPPPLTRASA
jgi:hypothetical protein